jgi:hypothetical protein
MGSFEPPPGWDEAMGCLAAQMRDMSEQTQRALASIVLPAVEQWSLQLPRIDWLAPMRAQLAEMGKTIVAAWERALPANWTGFSTDEVTAIIELAENTGLCLVWIPRAEIVSDVLAAGAPNASGVLQARREDVLDDASDALAQVTESELAPERDAAQAAIRALRDGHPEAAQALAASVLTSALHVLFRKGTSKIRRDLVATHPNDAVLQQLRLRTIYLAASHALSEFRPETARPMRRDFNRHNTAHRITAEQWTSANALSAIMLVAALLRELPTWLRRST